MRLISRIFILTVLLFGLAADTPLRAQFFKFEHPLLGQPAPDFTLETVHGGARKMSAVRGNGPAVILFWATWCPHCRQQFQQLCRRKFELEEQGFSVFVIDIQEPKAKVAAYLKQHGVEIDVFLDTKGDVSDRYGILGIPTYFLIDAQGIVRSVKNTFPRHYADMVKARQNIVPYGQSAGEPAGFDR